MTSLTALSPLDGRYAAKIAPLKQIMSEYGLIYYRVVVEVQWLIALSKAADISIVPKLSTTQKQALLSITEQFCDTDAEVIKDIERTTQHDVKAVEYYLQQKLAELNLSALIPAIHFGCTSADINNIAYALMVECAKNEVLVPQMHALTASLSDLAKGYANLSMLSRTHGQPASPTTLGKELANSCYRLNTQLTTLTTITMTAKCNGAVGNFNAHHVTLPTVDWETLSKDFIEQLGLVYHPLTTQIEPHDTLASLLHCLIRFNTILIDFNRDIWSYISLGYFQQKKIAGEVGSSTMPHKINPIQFENSEGNLGIANALAQHLAEKLPISRWQRDLSNSTVLRNQGVIFGYCLLAYQATIAGLKRLDANKTVITNDLNQHWEVLTEAVQTVMRYHGIEDAYEQLKLFSRGEVMTQQTLHHFIKQTTLPDDVKTQLLTLTPESYIGIAAKLAAKG